MTMPFRTGYCVLGVCAAAMAVVGFAGARGHSLPPAASVAAQDSPSWNTSAEVALTMARTRGKDVLIEFRDPQESAQSVHLDSAIFNSSQFRSAAGAEFVLLQMTSSSDASPAVATQVATWAQRLNVTEFPTIALLDSQGRPYAMTVCRFHDPVEALDTLQHLRQIRRSRDDSLVAAQHAQGLERAKHLDAALNTVSQFAEQSYGGEIQEILSLDADNAAGLRDKYQTTATTQRIDSTIQSEVYPLIDQGNLRGAIQKLDRLAADVKPDAAQMQLLLAFKGQLLYSLGEKQNAVEILDQAIRLSPNGDGAAKVRVARAQIIGTPQPTGG